MPIYNQPNLTSGIDDAIVTTAATVPVFSPMFLIFIFLTILLGGSVAQKRRIGTADVPMWTTLSSIITLMTSLILSLREGLVQPGVVGIIVAITCLSGFWLFFDRNRNEI